MITTAQARQLLESKGCVYFYAEYHTFIKARVIQVIQREAYQEVRLEYKWRTLHGTKTNTCRLDKIFLTKEDAVVGWETAYTSGELNSWRWYPGDRDHSLLRDTPQDAKDRLDTPL